MGTHLTSLTSDGLTLKLISLLGSWTRKTYAEQYNNFLLVVVLTNALVLSFVTHIAFHLIKSNPTSSKV